MKTRLVRRKMPSIIAQELVSVHPIGEHVLQDMTGSAYVSNSQFVFGAAVHRFIEGWGVAVSPDEIIGYDVFIDKYGSKHICPETMRERMCQWYFNKRSGTNI